MPKTFFAIRATKLITTKVGHRSLGFSRTDAIANIRPATVSAGSQKIAVKYIAPDRLRIARRIIFLFAMATLLASMLIGQSMMLDILASVFFAALITHLASHAIAAKRENVSRPVSCERS
jgi:hypothetical protein